MNNRNHFALTAVVGIALGFAAPAWAGEEIDERRDLDADGTVTVGNIAGDIEVRTWDRNELHLTGELGDESELEISGSGSSVRIEVQYPDSRSRHDDYEESDLYLVVPEGASLNISGVSSDITISGSKGASVRAETVSGDVTVEAETQRADMVSVSGDVTFSGSSPRTAAETVSGDVELRGLSGELEVSLVSGDVDVRGGAFSRAKFESVSGNIEVELEIESGGRLTAENMSGDVVLSLPRGQSAEFRAQTFSGDIDSDFGSPQKDEHGPGSHLKHVSGSGGTTIRVESFSGDIEIGQK